MKIDYKVIGRRIKKKRKQSGYTQETMAEAFSVTVGYISQIERGKTKISLDTLAEISTYLSCAIEELIRGSVPGQKDYLNEEFGEILAKMTDQERRMLLEMARIIVSFKDL